MKPGDERLTPDELFNELHNEFHFEIDLAATSENAKLPVYYTRKDSALFKVWDKVSFCNPPYSELYVWVKKAVTSKGLIVMILPCDTSTKWFHLLWDGINHQPNKGIQLRFPNKRFKFVRVKGQSVGTPQFATIIAVIDRRQ